jgi:hypothetical protein
MVYCGNNRVYADNKGLVIGTKYDCLRKGIGVGKATGDFKDYDEKYEPIDDINFFCGRGEMLPAGYDRPGTRSECFSKGYGRGRQIAFEEYSRDGLCAAILKTGPRKGSRCGSRVRHGIYCGRHM